MIKHSVVELELREQADMQRLAKMLDDGMKIGGYSAVHFPGGVIVSTVLLIKETRVLTDAERQARLLMDNMY